MDRLVEATATVWRDRELRGRLGESAREFVQRVHSPQAVGRQWAQLVRQVLAA